MQQHFQGASGNSATIMTHTAMPECKDTCMLLVFSQSGTSWNQTQKSRSTAHSPQWPSGQVIPSQGAESNVDCQVKPSPALQCSCALLQLQLGKQFWVSNQSLSPLGIFPSVSAPRKICSKTQGTSTASPPCRGNSLRSFGHRHSHKVLLWKAGGESLSTGLERKHLKADVYWGVLNKVCD